VLFKTFKPTSAL